MAVKGMKAAQAKEAGLWVPAEVAACADGEAHSGRDVAEGLVLGHYEYQGAKKVSKDAIELKKVTRASKVGTRRRHQEGRGPGRSLQLHPRTAKTARATSSPRPPRERGEETRHPQPADHLQGVRRSR
ncbi:MAG: hypothetical protein R3E96_13275 [Planctomycetota bacterium]